MQKQLKPEYPERKENQLKTIQMTELFSEILLFLVLKIGFSVSNIYKFITNDQNDAFELPFSL